ncbi:hypothetical protein B2J96_09505 [Mycobacterium shigaense]|nr:hypothetical protein B2J96_09505 [Mycobacterium shigaense]
MHTGRAAARSGRSVAQAQFTMPGRETNMTRKAGDRYTCSECGSTLVYEKDCPCCSESGHNEVCCDKPMEKQPA